MILRYHADAEISEWHDHVLRLPKTFHDEYGVAVEIGRVDEQHGLIADSPDEVRYPTSGGVCERDPERSRELNRVIKQTPSEVFKRHGKLDIVGNISVVDDGGTVW